MAYTQVVAQPPTLTGTALTYAAAEASGTAVRPGSTIYVKNLSGSSINVTLRMGRTYNGYTIADAVVAVANNVEMAIGPIPADPFVQTTGIDSGWCRVDYSGVTTVTRAVTT